MISTSVQRAIFALAILFFGIFLLYPVAITLHGAFGSTGSDPSTLLRILLSSPSFYERLWNSLNLAILTTTFAVILAFPAAWILTRHKVFGQGFFKAALLIPMVLPPFVSAIGIRKLFSRFGPFNLLLIDSGIIDTPIDWLGSGGLIAIAIVQALHLYPIIFLGLSAAIMRLDPSLEEAAMSLGAGRFRCFTRIFLPLLTPALFGGGILVFTWALTDLGTPLVFNYRAVLAVRVFEHANEIGTNPLGYTLVVTMATLCIGLFLGAQSLIPNYDITAGSKGSRGTALRKSGWKGSLLSLMALSLLLALASLPHLGILLVSLSKEWFMTILPTQLSLEAFIALPVHPLTALSIKNSIFLSIASTTMNIIFGVAIAWLLARGSVRGRKVLDSLTMAPLVLPGVVIAFGYLGGFSKTFLDPRLNPLPLLIFGYALRRLPFMVRAVDSGFRQCSASLEEAAALFGASPLTIVRRIIAPILAPHILAGGILCFCFAMLEVSESMILAVEERYFPITKAMYALLGRPDGAMIASALGVVSMLVITACLLLAKRLIGGTFSELLSR